MTKKEGAAAMQIRSTSCQALELLGSILLISCVATGSQAPTPQRSMDGTPGLGVQPLFALCPGGKGLCAFTVPDTWKVIFPRDDPRFVIEFRELVGGLALVKEQGHQASGSLFLVSSSGRLLLRRDLLQDMFFYRGIWREGRWSRGPLQ
jgi:hypothetical protein